VVLFLPQSVTMFLDEKIVVDIDKVVIEMPAEEGAPALPELKPGEVAPPADAAAADKAADKAAEDEQKKIDELFKK
jgi:hypothetical protein